MENATTFGCATSFGCANATTFGNTLYFCFFCMHFEIERAKKNVGGVITRVFFSNRSDKLLNELSVI